MVRRTISVKDESTLTWSRLNGAGRRQSPFSRGEVNVRFGSEADIEVCIINVCFAL
jgi:hypothetical protein